MMRQSYKIPQLEEGIGESIFQDGTAEDILHDDIPKFDFEVYCLRNGLDIPSEPLNGKERLVLNRLKKQAKEDWEKSTKNGVVNVSGYHYGSDVPGIGVDVNLRGLFAKRLIRDVFPIPDIFPVESLYVAPEDNYEWLSATGRLKDSEDYKESLENEPKPNRNTHTAKSFKEDIYQGLAYATIGHEFRHVMMGTHEGLILIDVIECAHMNNPDDWFPFTNSFFKSNSSITSLKLFLDKFEQLGLIERRFGRIRYLKINWSELAIYFEHQRSKKREKLQLKTTKENQNNKRRNEYHLKK